MKDLYPNWLTESDIKWIQDTERTYAEDVSRYPFPPEDDHANGLIQGILYERERQAAELDKLRTAQQWISIEERLPDDNTFEVLVKVDEPFFGSTDPKMIVSYYAHDLQQWICDLTSREVYHVTHWMPLPEPPKP